MKKDLSITIVAYGDYDDIKNAVQSIENFTDKSISKHIYIVDNSVNETDEKVNELSGFRSFLNNFTDISYLSAGSNVGFGKGHNYVLEELDSKYHAIVNPDIVLEDDAFSKMIEYLDSNDDIGMCIPKILDVQRNIQACYRKEVTIFDMFIRMFCKKLFPKRIAKHTLQYEDYSKPFQVPFGQGSFLVIRTDLFKELKGFDDSFFLYLEDADLCKRVNEVSKLMYYPDATVIHKWAKGSHKNKKLFKYHLDSMRYYFKKWGYKFF